jgi:FKBP-type peptidyl-prolyl cis-trans isomerase
MRLLSRFFVALCVVGFGVRLAAQITTPSSAPSPPMPDSTDAARNTYGFTEQQLLESWGWIIAYEKKADHTEISATETPAFMKGALAGFKGEQPPYDYMTLLGDVTRLSKERRQKYVQFVADQNQAAAKPFFDDLDKDPNVIKLPSGLRYQIIKPGTGPSPKPQQTVNVHYVAHLLNGTEFFQTGPIDLVLWPSRFNNDLYEGLQKINKGGVIRLYVSSPPSEDEVKMFDIPPGSPVIYEVELFDIKETPPDVLAMNTAPDAPVPDDPPPSGYPQAQIVEQWGWNTTWKTPVYKLGFGDAELSQLAQGLMEGINGKPPPCDMEKVYPAVAKFVNDDLRRIRGEFKKKQTAETAAFFAGLKTNPNVVELPSGLRYEIIKPGSGPYPAPGKTLKLQYVGRLIDGNIFEHRDGDDICTMELHNPRGNWPIPGMYEGLQKIKKGGEIKLYVPPALGYGDVEQNGAPAFSTLIFDVNLIDVQDTLPADAPPTSQP